MIDTDSGVDWVAAHIFTPGIEAIFVAGDEVAESASCIRIRSIFEDLAIMLVGISTNTFVFRVVRNDIDIVDRGIFGLFNLTELGINK